MKSVMMAFRVRYQTAGEVKTMTVLTEDLSTLEESVARKDKDYKIGERWSEISSFTGIPLPNVMVSELSVAELLALVREELK